MSALAGAVGLAIAVLVTSRLATPKHTHTHTHTHHTSLARLKQTTCGGVLEGRFPNEAQSAWEVDGVGLGEGLWLKRGPFLDVDPLYINCRVRLGG